MYSVHYPNYDKILDILSLTSTNSRQTSSIPLADFWHPERNESLKAKLCQEMGISISLDDLNPQKAEYSFEYPTPAYENKESQKVIDHSISMSDLMIRLDDEKGTRITIEAKYTEYVNKNKDKTKKKEYTPLLKDWYKNKSNKKEIIQRWINYIGGCGHISSPDDLIKNYPDLPYQFLHRTGSACFNCKRPILIYQLFYDEKHREEMQNFEDDLKCATEILHLDKDKLPFFIIETKVDPKSPVYTEHKKIKNPSDLFIYMKNEVQYKFVDIKVHDVYNLETSRLKH